MGTLTKKGFNVEKVFQNLLSELLFVITLTSTKVFLYQKNVKCNAINIGVKRVNDNGNSNIYNNLITIVIMMTTITVMVIMLTRISNHSHFYGKTVEPL